ncbi:hypothetical protein ACFCZ1_10535 [Streptomyces sp. NPDC056224]|uniref:hypothetical protein n=1 Tax=Streptomyces sp. NPDC056224 TaxID=3345750 RepID=UPI0035D61688
MNGNEPVHIGHIGRIGRIGDTYNASGPGSIGRIQNTYQGAQDPQAVFEDMIRAIQTLRGQVSDEDRQVIDESLETIRQGGNAAPGAFRRALGAVTGVAALVGEVGAPVAEAVRRVLALLAG